MKKLIILSITVLFILSAVDKAFAVKKWKQREIELVYAGCVNTWVEFGTWGYEEGLVTVRAYCRCQTDYVIKEVSYLAYKNKDSERIRANTIANDICLKKGRMFDY
jgi:hypothetical protein